MGNLTRNTSRPYDNQSQKHSREVGNASWQGQTILDERMGSNRERQTGLSFAHTPTMRATLSTTPWTDSTTHRTEVDHCNLHDRNRGIRHLSYSELMERKSKGQCFCCSERYHPLHRCADRQLRLVILGDEERVNEGEVVAIEVEEEELIEEPMECKAMGVFGITNEELSRSKTMKMEGVVKGVPLMILFDSGANHNFISPADVSVN